MSYWNYKRSKNIIQTLQTQSRLFNVYEVRAERNRAVQLATSMSNRRIVTTLQSKKLMADVKTNRGAIKGSAQLTRHLYR
jgi:hypothetical protein